MKWGFTITGANDLVFVYGGTGIEKIKWERNHL